MASEKTLQELFHDTLKDIYFRGKEDPVGLAENGEGGPVQGSQSRLPEARDRNRRARGAARKGIRGNRRSAPRQTCDAIMGIIEEGQEVMKEFKGAHPPSMPDSFASLTFDVSSSTRFPSI